MQMNDSEKNKALEQILRFVKNNKDEYNDSVRDRGIVQNFISGNGFSQEMTKVFESFSNGAARTRAKVNSSFLAGYVNQLKGMLIANKFDLSGSEPPKGLVNGLNNAALLALEESLNFGAGYIYIDGDMPKCIAGNNVILGYSEVDTLEDCEEAVILTRKQMDPDKYYPRQSRLVQEVQSGYDTLFKVDKNTALKAYHYKLDKEKRILAIKIFVDDELVEQYEYVSDYLPISRAVCRKTVNGHKISNRGIYIGVRDLLDGLSLDYSIIRSKVCSNPDAFMIADKRSLNDKQVSEAINAPFGRSVIPYIGSVSGSEGEPGKDLLPPQPLNVPFNIESLHNDIALLKSDIQNILGFNYLQAQKEGTETVEASLLRRDNSYNSQVAYIEPVAQAVMHIMKVYNSLLNTDYEVVNKVFVKIDKNEKLQKIMAIINLPNKGYEGLLAKYAGFTEDEAAEIMQASGVAQVVATAQQTAAQAQQLGQENENLKMELMNYRLDTGKVVESNQIRANVQLAKIQTDAEIELAKIAQKDKQIAQDYAIKVAKLIQDANEEINSVNVMKHITTEA